MRIIKPGKEPKKEIEQTCERCGCVFAYCEWDITTVGDYDIYHFVKCPHCGAQIEVEPWSGY